jgi:hypothetical protein
LIGIPFDRPVVGFGGQTINTLRLPCPISPRGRASERKVRTI